MKLTPSLFWDINLDELRPDSHARFIIERVLMRGRLADWFQIKEYYGLEKIKNAVVKARYLDKITLSFCSAYFDIPKEKFRCCITPPSIQKLWSY